jgi:hypothetical protein
MELALIVTTAVSVVVATAMALVAARLAREERRRSAARVATLASQLHDTERSRERAVVGIRAEPARIHSEPLRDHSVVSRPVDVDSLEIDRARGTAASAELFRAVPASHSRSTILPVLMVGGIALATALALVVATGRGGTVADLTAPESTPPATAAETLPLELVALSHDRDEDRITVRGVVRNPTRGVPVDQLAAVVFLFDRDGAFLDSGRAEIRAAALGPGAESPFAVTIGQAAAVGRYRISFRSGERVIPHVDRRPAAPVAQLK